MIAEKNIEGKVEDTEDREKILSQPTRREIYELIKNNEGIHFRSICRKLDRKMGVVQYHVSVLENMGLIRSIRDGRYKCFFAVDPHELPPEEFTDNKREKSNASGDVKEKLEAIGRKIDSDLRRIREQVVAAWRRSTPQKLLAYLAEFGKASHQKLSNIAQVSPQAITFHIKRLTASGLLNIEKKGRQKIYSLPKEVDKIIHSLIKT